MAYSNYDATTTNKSKRSNRIYSDLNLSFTKNPATKDVAKVFDIQAIKRAVKNIILTNKYERPFNPDFGASLRDYLFENLTPPILIKIKDRVVTAIEDFDGNGVNITVSFLVIGTSEPITLTTFLQRVR